MDPRTLPLLQKKGCEISSQPSGSTICSILVIDVFVNCALEQSDRTEYIFSRSSLSSDLCYKQVIPYHYRNVVFQLMPPPWPVVADLISPVVDHGTDPLSVQDLVHIPERS